MQEFKNITRKLFTKDLFLLYAILLIWLTLVCISNVRGNIPLNDDWDFAKMVKSLLEKGMFRLSGWAGMTILTQILWGSLFCSLFGFSFEILRLSTIILGTAGIICSYFIISRATKSNYIKFIATILIAVNPIYFLLSSTYMTDVPYYTLSSVSILFFIKYFSKKNKPDLLLAIIFIVAASFIRQLGALILLSFALTYCIQEKSIFKRIYSFIPLILLLISLSLFLSFIQAGGAKDPITSNSRMDKLYDSFNAVNFFGILPLLKNFFFSMLYISLFLSPLLLAVSGKVLNEFPKNKIKLYLSGFLLLSLVILFLLFIFKKLLPLRPNILWKYGLGPATLKDVDFLELENINKLPETVWILLTFIGILGFLFIIILLFFKVKELKFSEFLRQDSPFLFVFITTFLFLGLICLTDFYDRYLLQFLPLIIFLILKISPEEKLSFGYIKKTAVYLSIVLITGFTVYETNNYFSWNRCRWKALDYLTKELRVPVNKIDGGFEFNGWYQYDSKYVPEKGKSWWWVKDDEYIVSFGNLDNYHVFRTYDYKSITKVKHLYILKRD